ncbi:hypothetical protein FB567DRAFT_575061 [Paraphoma chrysanthemicola]|uniref:Uncharacterized protein n=1 Tax=Paraphoma chrysanthemicola TaxID=798071 RepID=A0A8K0RHQ2_9PLEO|nr:hypothetical protein FB567DRAFT_575061 [Paraphoma chrysanthemicola]
MCTDLAIRYECGHKIVSNFPCKSKKCKSIEKCTKDKARRCRVCDRDETARISRGRDIAVQSVQAIQSLLDSISRDAGAAEQRYFHAEQARKEGCNRVEELELALKEATERTPMPLAMCTEIQFTVACQHSATKHWCPDDDKPDECRFQHRLRTTIEENCMECRQQETRLRDKDIKKLQDRFAAEERRVKRLQTRVESLEETLSIAKPGLEWTEKLGMVQTRSWDLSHTLEPVGSWSQYQHNRIIRICTTISTLETICREKCAVATSLVQHSMSSTDCDPSMHRRLERRRAVRCYRSQGLRSANQLPLVAKAFLNASHTNRQSCHRNRKPNGTAFQSSSKAFDHRIGVHARNLSFNRPIVG